MFSGRINRKYFILYTTLLSSPAVIVLILEDRLVSTADNILLLFVSIIYLLIALIGSISLQVKRLHDVGLSGWYAIVFNIIPFGILGFFIVPGQKKSNIYGKTPD